MVGEALIPMMWLWREYLLIQFVEHTLAPHFQFGEETQQAAMLAQHAAVAALTALMVHTFFDGVSIAVASLVSPQLGVLIFIAILLHKLPEGFTVASMMLASGRSRRAANLAALGVGLDDGLSGVGIAFRNMRLILAHWRLRPAASAVVTLYVAASDRSQNSCSKEGERETSLLSSPASSLMYVTRSCYYARGYRIK